MEENNKIVDDDPTFDIDALISNIKKDIKTMETLLSVNRTYLSALEKVREIVEDE